MQEKLERHNPEEQLEETSLSEKELQQSAETLGALYQHSLTTEKHFEVLDYHGNRDGFLDPKEIPFAPSSPIMQSFESIDSNQDGKLSRQEIEDHGIKTLIRYEEILEKIQVQSEQKEDVEKNPLDLSEERSLKRGHKRFSQLVEKSNAEASLRSMGLTEEMTIGQVLEKIDRDGDSFITQEDLDVVLEADWRDSHNEVRRIASLMRQQFSQYAAPSLHQDEKVIPIHEFEAVCLLLKDEVKNEAQSAAFEAALMRGVLQVFDSLDHDGDGFISEGDLEQVMSDTLWRPESEPSEIGLTRAMTAASLKQNLPLLQKLSKDEWGWENNGVTRADLQAALKQATKKAQ